VGEGFLRRRESDRPPSNLFPKRNRAALPDAAARVAKQRERAREWMRDRRHRTIAGIAALIAIAAAVIAVVGLTGSKKKDNRAQSPSASVAVSASAPPPAPSASEAPSAEEPAKPAADSDPKAAFLSKAGGTPAEAASAFLTMFEANPKSLDDSEVQESTAALIIRGDPDDEAIKKIFAQLAYKTGTAGLDILYRVLEDEPTSGAAQRAAAVLYRQALGGRASPALSVALDLKRMNCARKIEQFDRAAKDGDERTARELEKLHPPGCVPRKGECCFRDNEKLESTLTQIRERKE
jgi:serine/threonine-protein kinase